MEHVSRRETWSHSVIGAEAEIVDRRERKKLRIGILIDDFNVPFWAYKMLERIAAGDYAELSLVVKNESDLDDRSFTSRIKRLPRHLALALYQRLDRIAFGVSRNAFEPVDLRGLVSADVLHVRPTETKFSDRIIDDDISKIRSYKIDVFLRLGFRILRGEILKAAKYGVWSFHHGDNDVNRGSPPGLWEVFQGWDETGVILQVLTEDLDNGVVLDKSFSATDKFSVNRNLNNYYWKALSLVPRKLEELFLSGETEFFERALSTAPPLKFYSNRLFKEPSNLQVVYSASQLALLKLKQKVSDFFYLRQWILLFALNDREELSKSIFRFKKIIPPKDRFWADPHVIKRDSTYYVFIEELMFRTNKGHISVLEIDGNGNVSEPRIVLDKKYHLSYPFVFEDEGTLYMIPETMGNRTIELYKCVEFPDKWDLEAVLMSDIGAVDTTILKKDGRYWLFANVLENEGASIYDELFLFSSDTLTSSNWKPHPRNPIVTDVGRARPAGRIFEIDGELYRPAQDCSKHYGYGIQICKILQLDEDNYEEELIDSIEPGWHNAIMSTHTLSFESKLTVIDAEWRRPRWD